MLPAAAATHGQRDDEKRQHRQQRNEQHHAEHGDAEIDLPVDALLQPRLMKKLAQLHGEEKEGGVVVHRGDVVGILSSEGVGIVARNQGGERIVAGVGGQIERGQVAVLEMRPHRFFLLRREGAFLRQHDHRDPVFIEIAFGNHHEIPGGILHAQTVQRLP